LDRKKGQTRGGKKTNRSGKLPPSLSQQHKKKNEGREKNKFEPGAIFGIPARSDRREKSEKYEAQKTGPGAREGMGQEEKNNETILAPRKQKQEGGIGKNCCVDGVG